MAAFNLDEEPDRGSPLYDKFQKHLKSNIIKARGFKYGLDSYLDMHMKEREMVIGNRQTFLVNFCEKEGINIKGNILVVGINDGKEVGFLKSKKIVGVDISEAAVLKGKKLHPHIEFICGDILSVKVPKNSIDTLLCFRTIHFFEKEEIEEFLRITQKALKEKGKIIVSVSGGFLSQENEIIFGQLVSGGVLDKNKPLKEAKEINNLLLAAGFKNIKIINHKIEIFLVAEK